MGAKSAATATSKGSVHQSILEWSEKRPLWQRDALRRLIEKSSLSDDDLKEIESLCRAEHNLLDKGKKSPAAVPLSRSHLPASETAGDDVSLEAICEVKYVNALAENQVFTLGRKGLTVIYGDNGVGKTGYSRILKRACRARNRGERIKPNIYKPTPKHPASATIKFAIGATSQEAAWIDGDTSAPELSAISFFDSQCAVAHVGNANDIAFTPFGLDLLEKLVGVCDHVKQKLTDDKQRVEREKSPVLLKPKCAPTTKVGRAISQLTAKSQTEPLAALANLSEQEQAKRQQLQADLATDPVKTADHIKARIRRLSTFAELVNGAFTSLNDHAVTAVINLAKDYSAKQQASRLAATSLFSNEPLPEIGGPTWRALWEAARRYSESAAYLDQPFPVLNEGSLCVLCQQELSKEARGRVHRFDQFVKNNAEQAAREAESFFNQAQQAIARVALGPNMYRDLLSDIASENPSLAHRIRRNIIELRLRRRSILRAIADRNWDRLVPQPVLVLNEFSVWLESLSARETSLRQSVDPKRRAAWQSDLQELDDRSWLCENLDDVLDELTRLDRLDQLNTAIKATVATQITNKSKALADEHVTNRLRDQFAEEIERLHIGKVKVELQLAASKGGASRYQIRFISAPNESLAAVLSEGEHRAIALAGFLTELATSPTKSALVFDDPVSSLDHKWRKQVARRLVAEAKLRQVIVFTHDIVFLNDLLDSASKKRVDRYVQQISRGVDGIGTVGSVLPWKVQKTRERLRHLKRLCVKAKDLFASDNEAAYEKAVVRIYDGLRATVERAIENDLFCGVVVRHRDYVNTRLLKKVSVTTIADCELLRDLFKRCSDITGAHDPSGGRNSSAPAPTEVEQDIVQLTDWVDDIWRRQKTIF